MTTSPPSVTLSPAARPPYGWARWPGTVSELAILARGLVELERSITLPPARVAVIDPEGLAAVVRLLRPERSTAWRS